MRGGDIRVAIEQERLSRVRHGEALWFKDPLALPADYCLAAENITLDDVGLIVGTDTLPARVRAGWRGRQLTLYPHHLAHASSAYLMLPPSCRAGIIVYDGYGSARRDFAAPWAAVRETVSLYIFGERSWQRIGGATGQCRFEEDDFPLAVGNSVGMFYEAITQLLGYGPFDAGKTMGLAAHGKARHVEALERFVRYSEDPDNCFECEAASDDFIETVEALLVAGGAGLQGKADLAASAQAIVEKALIHFAGFFAGRPLDLIAVSGGCGLNSLANGRLAASPAAGGLPIFIPPHCGDAGLGFGALWLSRVQDAGASPLTFLGSQCNPALARPGRCYTSRHCLEAANAFYPRLVFDPSVATPADLAEVIAGGGIYGLFNAASEFGPRALGGRSLLADPRDAVVRERINRRIKHREPFRPLAPVVLRSRFDAYFEPNPSADPFMLTVVGVTQRCRREAPAVVHADGTARVQIVDDETGDPFLVRLLQSFEQHTGVGVVINTSFNRRGEPIVETPLDAVDAFLGLELDGLFLDGSFFRPA
jgi:carbamoyltransferase